MSFIEWSDRFETGIPGVDLEHREIIELINRLHAELGSSDAEGRVASFLGDVFTSISAHFALEEKVMRDQGYKAYQPHKDDHEALLDTIRDIMDRWEDEGYFEDAEFSSDLYNWFTVHFREMDAKLHGSTTAA